MTLTSSPELFVDMLKLLYRAQGEEQGEVASSDQSSKAKQAFQLLEDIHTIPGLRPTDGEAVVDIDALRNWVQDVRRLAEAVGRRDVADIQIGHILSYAPQSSDETWPCQEVRDLIEELQCPAIEESIQIGKYNQRGVVWRGEDGQQEWELAQKYKEMAERLRVNWPRTATILDRLAEGYADEARRWDEQAKWKEYE